MSKSSLSSHDSQLQQEMPHQLSLEDAVASARAFFDSAYVSQQTLRTFDSAERSLRGTSRHGHYAKPQLQSPILNPVGGPDKAPGERRLSGTQIAIQTNH